MQWRLLSPILSLSLALLLAACGASQTEEVQFSENISQGLSTNPAAEAALPEAAPMHAESESAAEPAVDAGEAGALSEPGPPPIALAPPAPPDAADLPAPDSAGMIAEAPATTGGALPRPDLRQAPEASLKAGEIDDNERFADYLEYLRNYQWGSVRLADVSERYAIRVIGEGQRPLYDALVTVYAGERQIFQGRTYADGRTLFMPRIFDTQQMSEFRVVAEYGEARAETTLRRGESERVELGLRGVSNAETLRLDLLFMLDTTGSMGDELRRIQQTIDSIAARIDAFTPRPQLRYGLVAYKDEGDEYVTRPFDFTPDLDAFRAELAQLSAGGGGDIPEALDEALYDGMLLLQWRTEPTIRITFLVADAGPHVPGPSQFTYLDGIREAVARGIKIYPIAASGTDPQAEYVFRQLAQQTMAGFIFLTYQPGASGGAPGESTTLEAGEQPYSVERLDDLIVSIVERELRTATGAR